MHTFQMEILIVYSLDKNVRSFSNNDNFTATLHLYLMAHTIDLVDQN